MEYFSVRGGNQLQGSLTISGAKNSVLPLLAASVLFRKGCVLHNCPCLTDVEAAIEILRHLGCQVERNGHDIWVNPDGLDCWEIPRPLMTRMRSSVLFLGSLLARTGRCTLYEPGGCCLGARPIDLHLSGLQAMGAELAWQEDRLECRCTGLTGTAVTLAFPSVGATENLMMAALGGQGTTTIYNAAKEPEIVDLACFLRAGGARIYGMGTSMVQIEGGFPDFAEYTVLPDRMEAATFLAAAACAGGDICVEHVLAGHLTPVCNTLEAAGCQVTVSGGGIRLQARRLCSPPPIRTAPYPGFPTDAQAPVMAAMLRAEGTTVFEESVFTERYRHVPALRRLGGKIQVSGAIAAVTGVPSLTGATLEATDLRGGAAMVAAALGAEGESKITQIHHILRGYENFAQRLSSLGADVQWIQDPAAP